jgi:hypothetical protein
MEGSTEKAMSLKNARKYLVISRILMPLGALYLLALLLLVPGCVRQEPPPEPRDFSREARDARGEGELDVPPEVGEWLLDAKRVARERHQIRLFLDQRDVDVLGGILQSVHDRHVHTPLNAAGLRAEVSRWGAVCSLMVSTIHSPCRWDKAKNRNLGYGHSLFVPLDDGGWTEDDCFDLVDSLIREGRRGRVTIEGQLTLHFLD